MNLKIKRYESKKFAYDNLKQCAKEIIEWKETSILCDGKVRELARMCAEWSSPESSLNIAESIINNLALEEIASS